MASVPRPTARHLSRAVRPPPDLPEPPKRIVANLATAAAPWGLGIKPVAVFDWTASAYPDGDHIAWGNIDPAEVKNIGDAEGNILPEKLLNVAPDIVLTQTFDNTSREGIKSVVRAAWPRSRFSAAWG